MRISLVVGIEVICKIKKTTLATISVMPVTAYVMKLRWADDLVA